MNVCIGKTHLIILVSIFVTGAIYGDARITFVSGDCKLKSGGQEKPLEQGMVIKKGDVITTGAGGRAGIYDLDTQKAKFIKPNESYAYKPIVAAQAGGAGSLFKTAAVKTQTSVAGVRGFKKALPCSPRQLYIKSRSQARSQEWQLYRAKKFDEVIKATQSATDTEGVYLRAMSTYLRFGLKEADSVMSDLRNVLKDRKSSGGMRSDAGHTIGLIAFDQGDYPSSIKILSGVLENTDPKQVDELSYYMMIILNRFLGRVQEEAAVWKHADKYCAASKLVQRLKKE